MPENLYLGNLSGEFYDFVTKLGGFTLKKLKLDTDPHAGGPLRQILRHQVEVVKNPCSLI